MTNYLEKAERFIEENHNNPNALECARGHCKFAIKDFARYLDSQEKSEGKKIELLKEVIHSEEKEIKWPFQESLIKLLNEERNRINQIIDYLNAEK